VGKEYLNAAFGAFVVFHSAVFVAFNRHFGVAVRAKARLVRHNGQTFTVVFAI
jgi:hypothetical protein